VPAEAIAPTEEKAMPLQDKLDAMREMSKTRIPPETQAILQKSVADLRASGIMKRVAAVGQTAPDFTLPDADGRHVSLKDLRAHGHVVLSFYRGRW
jgi:hypothetical protein